MPQRIYNLDLLRAIAILMVLFFHLTQMILSKIVIDKAIYNLGGFGVNVFFVLSGFLIGGTYYKTANIKAGIFLLRRFLRTYPPYLVVLIISWFTVYFTRKQAFDLGYLLMVQNFYKQIPYFLVSWSLAVEEHFYILFALIILLFQKGSVQTWIWIFLFIAPIFFRYFLSLEIHEFGYNTTATYFQIDSISLGVLAAYLTYNRSFKFRSSAILSISLFLLLLITSYLLIRIHSHLIFTFGTTVLNIIITAFMLSLYFSKELNLSKTLFIRQNASMAYSIYLVHPLCIHVGILLFSRIGNLAVTSVLTLILVYTASYIFYTLIENPAIIYRNKIISLLN